MGFYGNITNTSNTTFQFDRIYSNRLTMDANTNNDGIFIGRYVLVEYDKNADYPIIYTKDEKFYSSNPNDNNATQIQYLGEKTEPTQKSTSSEFYKDDIGQVQKVSFKDEFGNEIKYQVTFYKCIGGEGRLAQFELITVTSSQTNYTNNYAIDEKEYGDSFDSTVWVKSYTDNGFKYVQIAELNSVVPTFNLIVDRPTSVPLNPHFDKDSTNVNYNMHVQPQWGFRVATPDDPNLSDEDTQWIKYEYDSTEDKEKTLYATGIKDDGTPIWEEDKVSLPAAIYYNKKAFEPKGDEKGVITRRDNITQDSINLTLGKSGKKYNIHNGVEAGYATSVQDDTQELTINLPAIGNMMSDAWDIIHGPNRNDEMREFEENDSSKKRIDSLQGRLNSIAAIETNQIPIKRTDNGKLVGTKINGDKNHEVIDGLNNVLKIDDFTIDDAWIKTQVNADNTPNAISIHHTFNPTDNSDINKLNINNYDGIEGGSDSDEDTGFQKIIDQDTIQLYVPKVDAAGHVIGTDIDEIVLPYGYKHFITNGLTTITDLALDSSTGRKTTADNTQDTLAIDTKNKWLQIEITDDKVELAHEIHNIEQSDKTTTNLNDGTDTITIQDTVYDNAGHIIANQNHTYTLPYGFKYIEVANDGDTITDEPASTDGTQTADNTQDTLKLTTSNKWILLDGNTEDNVQFGHLLKTVSTTDSDQNLSSEISEEITFKVYDDSFDEAGHHNGRDTKVITMPFGYGKITGDSGSTAATATYDSLAINSNDDWIATEVPTEQSNTINIIHTGPVTTTARNEINKIPKFGESFEIEDWVFDEKGHKANLSTHTVTIPQGDLTDATANGADVITQLTFDKPTGLLTSTRTNVGALKLTGYELPTQITNNGILSADVSINENFGKLEFRLNKEVRDRQDAIAKEIDERNAAIASSISAIVDKDDDNTINKLAEVIDWINNNPSTATEMQAAIQDNTTAIETEETRAIEKENEIVTELNNTNTTLTNLSNQLNEVDEKASILTVNMQDEIDTRTQEVYTLNSRCNTLDYEVKQLIYKVTELTQQNQELLSRIEALENPEEPATNE